MKLVNVCLSLLTLSFVVLTGFLVAKDLQVLNGCKKGFFDFPDFNSCDHVDTLSSNATHPGSSSASSQLSSSTQIISSSQIATSSQLSSSSSSSQFSSSSNQFSSSSVGIPTSGIIPQITQSYDNALIYPTPLLQDDARRGAGSECWYLEWLTQFAAYLQTPLKGTPRMQGNWSKAVSVEVNAFINFNLLALNTQCDANSMIYPTSAFPNRPILQDTQDTVGGLPAILFYVDPNGSDLNPGTINAPFQSIQYAVNASRIRTQRAAVICRAGTYYLSTPILLNSQDSNLVLMGYPGEDVVWAGTTVFSTAWTASSIPNVFQTPIPSGIKVHWGALNEIWAEGGHQVRARWPNGNMSTTVTDSWSQAGKWVNQTAYVPGTTVIFNNVRSMQWFQNYQMGYNGSANAFIPPQNYFSQASPQTGTTYMLPLQMQYTAGFSPKVAQWTRTNTSYLHAIHCFGWGIWQFRMSGITLSNSSISLAEGGFQETRGCTRLDCQNCGTFGVFVDHQLAELDSPGEYYIDNDARIIYYWPITSPPSTLEVSQTPRLLIVSNATNVTISGITFARTSNTWMTTGAANGGGDWTNSKVATIQLTDCQNCSVVNCLITDVGSNGIGVNGASNGTFIAYNEISHTSANGIAIMGDMIGYNATMEFSQPRWTLIKSNFIWDVGYQAKQSGHIYNSLTYETTITNNVLVKGPRSSVNFQDGFAGGHVFAYNLLIGSARETGDVGPFNQWNRVPYWTLNKQSNTYSWITSLSYAHHNLILVDNNAIRITGAAFDLDDGSNSWVIYQNLALNSRIKNYQGANQQYFNNTFFPFQGYGCSIFPSGLDGTQVFSNNTCAMIKWSHKQAFADVRGYTGMSVVSNTLIKYSLTSSNNYMLPPYGSDTCVSYSGLDTNLTSFQAIGLPNHNELGSITSTIPSIYPYYRFWGPVLLGYNDSLAILYSQVATIPTFLHVAATLGVGSLNRFTDSNGVTWSPMNCRDACTIYGGPTLLTGDNLLWTYMHYRQTELGFSYSYTLQNGSYDISLIFYDTSGGSNVRIVNVTINGNLVGLNVNPHPQVLTLLRVKFNNILINNNILVVAIDGYKPIISGIEAVPTFTGSSSSTGSSVGSSSSSSVAALNPVHAYAMQSNLVDLISGIVGTVTSGIYSSSTRGNALTFTGSGFGDLNVALTSVYTTCIWVKVNAFTTISESVWLSSPDASLYSTFVMGASTTSSGIVYQGRGNFTSCGNRYYQATAPYTQPSIWNHVCFTWSGSIAQVYVNGVLGSSVSAPLNGFVGGADIRLGVLSCWSYAFNGQMQALGIWDQVLSSSQVSKIYNNQVGITTITLSSFSLASGSVSVSSSSVTIQQTVFTILGAGQSNEQGAGPGGDPTGLDVAAPNLKQYVIGDQYSLLKTNINQIIPAAEPLNDGYSLGIGSMVALGNKFITVNGISASVVIVQTAVAGTSISQWQSTLFNRALASMTNYSNLIAPGIPNVIMIKWVQGENDVQQGTSASTYQSALIGLINLFRTLIPGANSITPFILVSMVPDWVATQGANGLAISNVHRSIPNLVPYTAFRASPMGMPCSLIHYSATGQRINAQLFFQAYVDALLNTAAGMVPAHPATVSMTFSSNLYQLTWSTITGATNYILIYRTYIPWANSVCSDFDPTPPTRLFLNSTSGSITLPITLFTNNTLYQFDVSAVVGSQPSSQGPWSTFTAIHSNFAFGQSILPLANLTVNVPLQMSGSLDLLTYTSIAASAAGDLTYNATTNSMQFTAASITTTVIPTNSSSICIRFMSQELVYKSLGRIIFGASAASTADSGALVLGIINSVLTLKMGTTTLTGPAVNIYQTYHTCATYNSTTAIGNIYLDGALVKTGTIIGATSPGSTDAIALGAQFGLAWPWNGQMSCFTSWSTVLSAIQVQALYNLQLNGTCNPY